MIQNYLTLIKFHSSSQIQFLLVQTLNSSEQYEEAQEPKLLLKYSGFFFWDFLFVNS
jgi:hypothetical protein